MPRGLEIEVAEVRVELREAAEVSQLDVDQLDAKAPHLIAGLAPALARAGQGSGALQAKVHEEEVELVAPVWKRANE